MFAPASSLEKVVQLTNSDDRVLVLLYLFLKWYLKVGSCASHSEAENARGFIFVEKECKC